MSGRKSPDQQNDPAIGAVEIDYAGDDQDFDVPVRALYISTAGNLAVTMTNGTQVTFENLAAGQIYPLAVSIIHTTGSTAAGVALY